MTIAFESLWSSYPTSGRDEFFRELSGDWPRLIDDTISFGKTCALRMTVALRRCGQAVPLDLSRAGCSRGKARQWCLLQRRGPGRQRDRFGVGVRGCLPPSGLPCPSSIGARQRLELERLLQRRAGQLRETHRDCQANKLRSRLGAISAAA